MVKEARPQRALQTILRSLDFPLKAVGSLEEKFDQMIKIMETDAQWENVNQ